MRLVSFVYIILEDWQLVDVNSVCSGQSTAEVVVLDT